MKKRWDIKHTISLSESRNVQDIINILLKNRGIHDAGSFMDPRHPMMYNFDEIGIDQLALEQGIDRIISAIQKKESIIVYGDYDADGITATAILWETIYKLGGNVLPYIPHRVEEGYGLSTIGIDTIKKQHNAQLIVTVDQGITGWEKVLYAKSLGVDVIITDHHTKPEKLPDAPIIHTTKTSGAGVSWFVAKHLLTHYSDHTNEDCNEFLNDLAGIASIGIIADLLPLIDVNRSFVFYGLRYLSSTSRIGMRSLLKEAGILDTELSVYHVSHMIAPRLNALGRLDHALDALRLLCTKDIQKGEDLAKRLNDINKDRQNLTLYTTLDAIDKIRSQGDTKKVLILSDDMYNPGIIGLAAGKLVEEFYRPAIVIAKGQSISKASARSIPGFNIIQALRHAGEFLLEVGGHPMAAGFSIETHKIEQFQHFFEQYVTEHLSDALCIPVISVDIEIPIEMVSFDFFTTLQSLAPFGMGNPTPVFLSRGLRVFDVRSVGDNGKHIKLKLVSSRGGYPINAVGFNMGELLSTIKTNQLIDVVYTVEENEWNGKKNLQIKIKDVN
ncbi:MAG: single-stranded-DNA-specific exonuclease RecJ [Patescibacteria group bacterium]|nr:single-stranded-DNA-specific exonuclease RecJ [Patescibacteria group bacterium]